MDIYLEDADDDSTLIPGAKGSLVALYWLSPSKGSSSSKLKPRMFEPSHSLSPPPLDPATLPSCGVFAYCLKWESLDQNHIVVV